MMRLLFVTFFRTHITLVAGRLQDSQHNRLLRSLVDHESIDENAVEKLQKHEARR
jgi:hypothetical protein